MNTNKPPIVQITPYYPPNLGGLQNCVKIIAEYFSQKEYDVTVITSNISYEGPSPTYQNRVTVHYLPSVVIANTPISFGLLFQLFKIPKHALLHIHIANAFFPDMAYFVSMIRNLTYIAHYHIDVEASGLLGKIILPIYKTLILKNLLRKARKVICLTQSQKKHVIEKYHIASNRIEVIPNGVSEEFFMNVKRADTKKIKLLFVGRLSLQKNIPRLISACHLLPPNIELDIVGDGDQKNHLQTLVSMYELPHVHFHGEKTGKALLHFYKNADIFVLPSDNEGMSLSLLEAAAAGLPIITTYLPQTEDFLKKGAILIAEPTAEKYAEAILSLANSYTKRVTMSEHNKAFASQCLWTCSLTRIEKIYNTLV